MDASAHPRHGAVPLRRRAALVDAVGSRLARDLGAGGPAVSRALSLAARQAVNAQETGEVFLLLLTLDHDELAAPIRVVNNTVDIVSRGNTYIAYPFQLELPAEDADQISSVRLSIDNVDRTIVQSLRA